MLAIYNLLQKLKTTHHTNTKQLTGNIIVLTVLILSILQCSQNDDSFQTAHAYSELMTAESTRVYFKVLYREWVKSTKSNFITIHKTEEFFSCNKSECTFIDSQ